MADFKNSKINPRLGEKAGQPGTLDAVVELVAAHPPEGKLSRQERIRHMREDFEQRSSPVEEAVKKAGGEVLERAWINGSLLVRLPAAESLEELADLEEVGQLDSPAQLKPER